MQTPTSTFTKTGDLGGQVFKMGMDENAMNHIMGILTEIYSDDELAVIREYSTNAWDAHREAGVTAPIEVFTPNNLSPFFRVKDHGVGLSVDDVEKVFSKYGASTKRDTNEQVGMLGIGAKSALALVPQFNVTSVKNGVKISVIVSRNEQDAAEMRVVDSRATDEPNGVEVMIPVPRSHTFMEKCRHFFRFWTPGTVLLDGKDPKFITGRPVGDKFLINHNLDKDYIVMGNVAYPYKGSLYEHSYRALGIVAFVNIGDVNFAPSREELHYTPHTRATIAKLQTEFATDLPAAAAKDVDEADTHVEAWNRARQWRSTFYNRFGDLTYKGIKIPTDISFDAPPLPDDAPSWQTPARAEGKEVELYVGRGRRHSSWCRSVNPSMLNAYMFVTGFAESLKMSTVQRERAEIYAKNQGWTGVGTVVIFKQDKIITNADHLAFLEGIKIVPWPEIAKIKIQRAKSERAKRTEKYDQFMGGYSIKEVSEFDVGKDIIYISPAENKTPDFLRTIFPDAQIVLLGANRWEKFKRDWPTAKHYEAAVADICKGLIDQFTETDRILWNYGDHYSRHQYRWMMPSLIEDPDLKRFAEILNGKGEFSDPATKLKAFPRGYNNPTIEVPDNPLTKYPMAGSLVNADIAHAHWYINTYFNYINSQED